MLARFLILSGLAEAAGWDDEGMTIGGTRRLEDENLLDSTLEEEARERALVGLQRGEPLERVDRVKTGRELVGCEVGEEGRDFGEDSFEVAMTSLSGEVAGEVEAEIG